MFKRMSWIVLLSAGLCAASDIAKTRPDKTSGVTELEGQVISVDPTNRRLNVKDKDAHNWTINVERDTPISSSDNDKLTLSDLRERDKVHIYYTTADMMARQIDRIATFGVMGRIGTR